MNTQFVLTTKEGQDIASSPHYSMVSAYRDKLKAQVEARGIPYENELMIVNEFIYSRAECQRMVA